jgi:hypothetical protein
VLPVLSAPRCASRRRAPWSRLGGARAVLAANQFVLFNSSLCRAAGPGARACVDEYIAIVHGGGAAVWRRAKQCMRECGIPCQRLWLSGTASRPRMHKWTSDRVGEAEPLSSPDLAPTATFIRRRLFRHPSQILWQPGHDRHRHKLRHLIRVK